MNRMPELYESFFDYSECVKGNTERSVKWFREVLRYFQEFADINYPGQITRDLIEKWLIYGKRKKNWSDKTRRTRLQALRSFCDWLVINEYLVENPARKIPLVRVPKTIPDFLSAEKAEELLQVVKHMHYFYIFDKARAYAIIATFLITGIRKSELEKLKLHHIDLQEKVLIVKAGKGKKDRIIPFCSRLKTILDNYVKHRTRLNKKCDYFFVSMRSNTAMDSKVIPRLTKRIYDEYGIKCNPHLLRHTFAVLMIQGGADIYHVAELLGHGDIGTTVIYLKAAVNHLKRVTGRHPLNFH